MTKTLTIELVIPLQGSIVLAKWPEFKLQDFPIIAQKNLSLRLWFDASSTQWATPSTEEELKKTITPALHRVTATVTIIDVADDFAAWIESTRNPNSPENFAAIYRALADQVYDLVVSSVNRLISYIRVEKGQYWVDEYKISDRKDLHVQEQRAMIESGKWFSWYPPNHPICIDMPSESNPRYMDKADWGKAWDFVDSNKKPTLILELLAKAETLHHQGHERSALTEAVTALEIAVFAFARKADGVKFIPKEILNRFDTTKMDKIVEHLGCTTTVAWLFPLIFTEEQMSSETLKLCREAISERQNVIHNGQRQVTNLERQLGAIRSLSVYLFGLTRKE